MEIYEQLLMVLLVFGLLGGFLWWARRKGLAHVAAGPSRSKRGRRLEVVDRLILTPHHSLHLVRMADRTLLIGLSPSSCTLLESAGRTLDDVVRAAELGTHT